MIAFLEGQKCRGRPGTTKLIDNNNEGYTDDTAVGVKTNLLKEVLQFYFITACFCFFTAGFFVYGLNLTEDTAYVLLHPLQSIQKMTTSALSLLLSWVSEQKPGHQVGGVNILCCDFVDVSNFCSIIIGLNYKLLDAVRRKD